MGDDDETLAEIKLKKFQISDSRHTLTVSRHNKNSDFLPFLEK